MTPLFKLMYPAVVVMLWTSCNTTPSPPSQPSAGRTIDLTEMLTIRDAADAQIVSVRIAVAQSPEDRNLGLMDVRQLPEDAGMLFIFDTEERLSFWMANTPLPLDLIFANTAGEVVHIHQNAQPFSRQNIDSVYPALYVLEVNAGFTITHDIQIGHRLEINP